MHLANVIYLSNANKSNYYFFEYDEAETIYKHIEVCFYITTSNHELLIHGSGKLFYEKDKHKGI